MVGIQSSNPLSIVFTGKPKYDLIQPGYLAGLYTDPGIIIDFNKIVLNQVIGDMGLQDLANLSGFMFQHEAASVLGKAIAAVID